MRKSDIEKINSRRKMSAGKRKKLTNDLARVRLHIDVSKWQRKAVIDEATNKHCSWSSMAAFLMALGLREYRKNKEAIDDFLRPSSTPRFQFEVDVDTWQKEHEG